MRTSESSEEADETIDIGLETNQSEIVKEDLSTSLSRESKLKSFLSLRSFSKETASTDTEEKKHDESIDPESGIEFVPSVNLPAKRFCEACNHE